MNFTQKVWQKIKQIPKGKVASYSEIATAIGKPKSTRAVGLVCSKNKSRTVPCHRVIRKNGLVGGFNQGRTQKIKLLKKEGVKIINNEIPPSFFYTF